MTAPVSLIRWIDESLRRRSPLTWIQESPGVWRSINPELKEDLIATVLIQDERIFFLYVCPRPQPLFKAYELFWDCRREAWGMLGHVDWFFKVRMDGNCIFVFFMGRLAGGMTAILPGPVPGFIPGNLMYS